MVILCLNTSKTKILIHTNAWVMLIGSDTHVYNIY